MIVDLMNTRNIYIYGIFGTEEYSGVYVWKGGTGTTEAALVRVSIRQGRSDVVGLRCDNGSVVKVRKRGDCAPYNWIRYLDREGC